MTVAKTARGARLTLRGRIDETCDLSSIFSRSGEITLDLEGVAAINSSGVMRWCSARQAGSKDLVLRTERVPPPMLALLNITSGLIEASEVVSVLAPYYCELCDKEKLEPLDAAAAAARTAPAPVCQLCGGQLELDQYSQAHFDFLRVEGG